LNDVVGSQGRREVEKSRIAEKADLEGEGGPLCALRGRQGEHLQDSANQIRRTAEGRREKSSGVKNANVGALQRIYGEKGGRKEPCSRRIQGVAGAGGRTCSYADRKNRQGSPKALGEGGREKYPMLSRGGGWLERDSFTRAGVFANVERYERKLSGRPQEPEPKSPL